MMCVSYANLLKRIYTHYLKIIENPPKSPFEKGDFHTKRKVDVFPLFIKEGLGEIKEMNV